MLPICALAAFPFAPYLFGCIFYIYNSSPSAHPHLSLFKVIIMEPRSLRRSLTWCSLTWWIRCCLMKTTAAISRGNEPPLSARWTGRTARSPRRKMMTRGPHWSTDCPVSKCQSIGCHVEIWEMLLYSVCHLDVELTQTIRVIVTVSCKTKRLDCYRLHTVWWALCTSQCVTWNGFKSLSSCTLRNSFILSPKLSSHPLLILVWLKVVVMCKLRSFYLYFCIPLVFSKTRWESCCIVTCNGCCKLFKPLKITYMQQTFFTCKNYLTK